MQRIKEWAPVGAVLASLLVAATIAVSAYLSFDATASRLDRFDYRLSHIESLLEDHDDRLIRIESKIDLYNSDYTTQRSAE